MKDPSRRSKQKLRRETFSGHDQTKVTAESSWKERIIDADADRYFEHVEAPDGRILRHVDEPLNQHKGHGSAKKVFKPK